MDSYEETRSEELCGPGERARRGQPSTMKLTGKICGELPISLKLIKWTMWPGPSPPGDGEKSRHPLSYQLKIIMQVAADKGLIRDISSQLIVSVPEFRFVKQLVLVQIVKLGDLKLQFLYIRPSVLKFVPERATLQI